MANNITERLNSLKADTNATLLAVEAITLDEGANGIVNLLRARLAEINNCLQISSVWDSQPPITKSDIAQYRLDSQELADRIRELARDRLSAGKSGELIK